MARPHVRDDGAMGGAGRGAVPEASGGARGRWGASGARERKGGGAERERKRKEIRTGTRKERGR